MCQRFSQKEKILSGKVGYKNFIPATFAVSYCCNVSERNERKVNDIEKCFMCQRSVKRRKYYRAKQAKISYWLQYRFLVRKEEMNVSINFLRGMSEKQTIIKKMILCVKGSVKRRKYYRAKQATIKISYLLLLLCHTVATYLRGMSEKQTILNNDLCVKGSVKRRKYYRAKQAIKISYQSMQYNKFYFSQL